jgi:hypothetical protein
MFRFPLPGIARAAFVLALFGTAHASAPADGAAALELSFIKGDTRDGTKVRLRILGDSIYYRRIVYAPGSAPRISDQALPLDIQRERTLKGLLGELPRYPAFGSCFGKGMRYYLVETGAGKFYRSVPERAGKCYLDEPGIFGLFEDLDDLLAPPGVPQDELPAS